MDRLYSLKEAAEILGVKRTWIYNRARAGKIEFVRLGAAWKISKEELERVKKEGCK